MNAHQPQPSSWAWYRAALADPKSIGKVPALAIHENDPQMGYYRKKRGRGEVGWVPVAILPVDGVLTARIGPWNDNNFQPAEEVWTWVCRYPVAHKVYTAVAVNGEEWPDSISTLIKGAPDPKPKEAEPEPELASMTNEGPAQVGHNSGAEPTDVFAELKDRFEEVTGKALAEAEKIGQVTVATWTPEQAVKKDRLANWTNEISAVAKLIEDAFKVEKNPWLEGGRAVDKKWKPLKDDTALKRIKAKIADLIMVEKAYLQAEAAKRAEAARLAAPGIDDSSAPADPIKVTAGTTGRKVYMVTTYEATITDPMVFAEFLLSKQHVKDELMATLKRLAQAYAKFICDGEVVVPGVTATSKEVPR